MPVNLSVKNVPDDLADRPRERGRRSHRSPKGEFRVILEGAVEDPGVAQPPGMAATAEHPGGTAYDAASLILAEERGGDLVTLDGRLEQVWRGWTR